MSPACARATTRSGIAGFDGHALDGYALMAWSLRFHGVGNASAVELGSPMATIERDGAPWLTIDCGAEGLRSEEHTSELQSLVRISYAVFCLKKKTTIKQ